MVETYNEFILPNQTTKHELCVIYSSNQLYSREEVTLLQKFVQNLSLAVASNGNFYICNTYFSLGEVYESYNLLKGKQVLHIMINKLLVGLRPFYRRQ